jgi:hypothetical protein
MGAIRTRAMYAMARLGPSPLAVGNSDSESLRLGRYRLGDIGLVDIGCPRGKEGENVGPMHQANLYAASA